MLDKSLTKGTLWTIIFFLGSFAKTIILTPLMLVHWGKELFSFWAIILSARAIILFLSDGYVRYVVNQYNLFYHTNEPKANRVLAAGLSFLLLLSLATITILFSAFFVWPTLTAFVFDTQTQLFSFLPLCLIAYISAASVQNIQRMYAATKEAKGLVWHNMFIEVFMISAELLLLSFLLNNGSGFSKIVLADSAIILSVAVLYLFYLLVKYPLGKVWSAQLLKDGAQDFRKATQLYASNFFEKLTTDGLVLLLSFFRFDKAAIALFATIRTIVNTPLLAQNLLLNTYTPQLQKDFALRNNAGLNKLFTLIRLRIGLVLLAGILCCFPLYEPLFTYWTKGAIGYNQNFMLLMLMMAVLNIYGLSFAFVFKGLNVLPQMLGLMFLKSLLVVLGFYLAQQNIEIIGWALVLSEAIVSVVLLPLLLHRFWQKEECSFTILQSYLAFIPYFLVALTLFLISLKF